MKIKTGKSWNSIALSLIFVFMETTDIAFVESKELYVIPKILIVVFFAFGLFSLLMTRRSLPLTKDLIAPTFFLFLEIACCAWSAYPSSAFAQFKTQIQLFILFVFVYYYFLLGEHINEYILAVYLAGFVMAVYALSEYGFNGILSMMQEGTRVGVGNQNTYGMVFSKASLAAFTFFVSKKNPVHIASIAFFTFFAFSSGSRKAILMIFAGIILISLLKYGLEKMWVVLLVLLFVVLALVAISKLPFMVSSAQRLIDTFNGEKDASQLERERLVQIGWQAIKQKPLLGYGIGTFAKHFPGTGYAHNNYIELLFSLGLFGFVPYYFMYFSPLFRWAKSIKLLHNERYVLLLSFLLINVIFGWEMVELYIRNTWVLLAIELATTFKIYNNGEKKINGYNKKNHQSS